MRLFRGRCLMLEVKQKSRDERIMSANPPIVLQKSFCTGDQKF